MKKILIEGRAKQPEHYDLTQ